MAVDVGGTFTDFVYLEGGSLRAFKLPSSATHPQSVLLDGLSNTSGGTVGHGTTVVTNAVLEGKGARTALITTAGFEDSLRIARQRRPKLYDLRVTRPEPLVPREATFGLRERVGPHGEVISGISREDVESLLPKLKAAAVESVAVSLLFSFLNPTHEELVGEILGQEFPVSLSSQVLPEFREYERTSTTVLDALVRPLVAEYLGRVGRVISDRLFVMRSNGGVRAAENLIRTPVEMLLSGPAGGVAGARFLAEALGEEDLMTLDMGGTSTDISIIYGGQVALTAEAEIGGYPLALPSLDIVTIGAGGGSIAWLDQGGALRVGPRSAGADPGPMCYGKGGDEPTLTDADLVAGLLGTALLGGRMPLDKSQAETGLTRLGDRLGLGRDRLLSGIRRVVVSNMLRAASLSFARRGLDPRDFSLLAFGGAGPMHATELARELGIRRVIVPPFPGAFSAYGILVSDVRLDYGRSLVRPLEGSEEELDSIWSRLEEEAGRDLAAQGVDPSKATLQRSLDLRYRGQSYEINVPVGDVEGEFRRLHQARYGYSIEGEEVEVVNVRLVALVPQPRPLPRPIPEEGRVTERSVLLADGWTDVPVHQRVALHPGFEAPGPLMVEEDTATTVIDGDSSLRVDDLGCLRLEVS